MRTDATELCSDCAIRFPRRRSCPRCGREGWNLRDERLRRDGWDALGRRWPGYGAVLLAPFRQHGAGIAWTFAGIFLLGGAVNLLVGADAVVATMMLLVGAALGGVGLVLRRRPRARLQITLASALPPPDPRLVRHTLRGLVRVEQPLVAPLSGEACAAFTLRGEGPHGPVADAAATAFEVVAADGTVLARVDAAEASVELGDGETEVVTTPAGSLGRFLDDRGAFLPSPPPPLRLREAVLRPGDAVEVEGMAEETLQAAGYRGGERVLAFRDVEGAPLVVRRPLPVAAPWASPVERT